MQHDYLNIQNTKLEHFLTYEVQEALSLLLQDALYTISETKNI